MTPVLQFENISRSFKKGVPVLDGVTFSMAEGEVVGLLGRNGAGKTTLIRIAMGMLFPHTGTVRVFGLSPTGEPVAVKKRIGYVAEDQVLPGSASLAELISLHDYLFDTWDPALERQLLDRFGLDLGAKIRHLSKGQARQAALICAVCHRPDLLVLDEPAGGLDPAARREFLETSIELLNREGTAILFSSHHMTDVERLGGRVVLLDGGKVRLDRPLDQIHEDHCVVMIPRDAVASSVIESLPGCLRVRPVFGDWHAVFEGAPDSVRLRIQAALHLDGIRCVSVPLEELFVELVGNDRPVEVSS
ncbi:MAG TPA: ABC transporter ATP-binding protein [Bryobacteraceae bacterium]|jgi:ABC-2 type transport system ATP-binding protein|nr:ABC transporter ATP-binding protein [Bryobacteraceae bacterium]